MGTSGFVLFCHDGFFFLARMGAGLRGNSIALVIFFLGKELLGGRILYNNDKTRTTLRSRHGNKRMGISILCARHIAALE